MEVIGGPVMKKSKKFYTSFDLDKAVAEWIKRLRRSGALEDGMIAELQAHLRDEVEDLVGQGKSPEDAFHEVTASVESVDVIGREYYKTYARGLFATPPRRSGGFGLFITILSVGYQTLRAATANPVDSLRYE